MKLSSVSTLALGTMVLGSSNAFVSPHQHLHPALTTSSTDTQKANFGTPSTVSPPQQRQHHPRGQNMHSPIVMQANLFDRFFRVARGNLNNALSKFEDPEKVMNQALEDMQNDILKVRQTYAEVTATQRRLEAQRQKLESVADDWYNRAQLAMKRQNEGLAREALTRREQALQQASTLGDQIETQRQALDKLYSGMQNLEQQIRDAQSKKAQLAARARTAKVTQWTNDMLSGVTGQTSMDAFKRMEDKVNALEAAAEVSAEMANNNMMLLGTSSNKNSIEKEFQLLEASDAVEKELQKLKAATLPEKSSASSTTSAATSNPVRIPISTTSSYY